MILTGHPTGNPNSHQAFMALAENRQLYAICIPWNPSKGAVRVLSAAPFAMVGGLRFRRRHFQIEGVKQIQGRIWEVGRLVLRALGSDAERLSYQANDWLMTTSSRYVKRPEVTAVHSYEDCSLLQFQVAKRLDKTCIYDMPIGYYPAWQVLHPTLTRRFSDWIAKGTRLSSQYLRLEQKKEEMNLADLVLAPSAFVADTIKKWHPHKKVATLRYGIDVDFWHAMDREKRGCFRFIYAGACSVRKGVPLLLEAWKAANLSGCELILVGGWHLNVDRLKDLPRNVHWLGPVDRFSLRKHLWDADCLVAPTFFEGRALIIGEAMATGIPVITTSSSGCEDLVGFGCGKIIPSGDLDALVAELRWASACQDEIVQHGVLARKRALTNNWTAYRAGLSHAVSEYV